MFVPIDHLRPVMGDLLALGRPSTPPRPWLGVNLQEFDGKLVVGRVALDGPGDRAGIRRGDLVTALDGTPVHDLADFYRTLWQRGEAGIAVRLSLARQGEERDVEVTTIDRYRYLRLERPPIERVRSAPLRGANSPHDSGHSAVASISSSTAEPIVRRLSTLEGSGFELSVPRPIATVSRLCRDGAERPWSAAVSSSICSLSAKRPICRTEIRRVAANRGTRRRHQSRAVSRSNPSPVRALAVALSAALKAISAVASASCCYGRSAEKPAEASTTMPASDLLAPASGSPCGGSILITSAPALAISRVAYSP